MGKSAGQTARDFSQGRRDPEDMSTEMGRLIQNRREILTYGRKKEGICGCKKKQPKLPNDATEKVLKTANESRSLE
jgi:hypothetical protein